MKWIAFLLCFYGAAQLPAADTAPSKSISKSFLKADYFYGVDDFNQLYYSLNDVLYRTADGKKMQFYDITLGELSSVDIINPLKVVLFYKDTQTVVFLDNRLNESLRIRLNQLQPYRFIEYVKLAGERRLWIYNLDENRLELYNYIDNRTLWRSTILKNKVINMTATYLICHLVTDKNVVSFNNYGSKTCVLDKENIQLSHAAFNNLATLEQDNLMVYEMDDAFCFRESVITIKPLTENELLSLYLKAGKLYIYDGESLVEHLIKPPKK